MSCVLHSLRFANELHSRLRLKMNSITKMRKMKIYPVTTVTNFNERCSGGLNEMLRLLWNIFHNMDDGYTIQCIHRRARRRTFFLSCSVVYKNNTATKIKNLSVSEWSKKTRWRSVWVATVTTWIGRPLPWYAIRHTCIGQFSDFILSESEGLSFVVFSWKSRQRCGPS